MKEREKGVRMVIKVLSVVSLLTTTMVSTSMGMRLEPGGEYTGVTLVISDDVPDHDCEEMLAKLKVNYQRNIRPKCKFNGVYCSKCKSKDSNTNCNTISNCVFLVVVRNKDNAAVVCRLLII